MTRMVMLEHMNGFRFALGAFLLLVLVRYLWRERLDWPRHAAVPFAFALFLNFLGDTALRGLSWYWARAVNRGADIDWLREIGVYWFVASGIVATVGVVAIIWITSPPHCRVWGWPIALGLSAAFVLASYWDRTW